MLGWFVVGGFMTKRKIVKDLVSRLDKKTTKAAMKYLNKKDRTIWREYVMATKEKKQ